MKIEEILIKDLESLVKVVIEVKNHFQGQVWWRGQGCYGWKLSPSVVRNNGGYEYEQNAIFRFKQRAPSRYPNTPADSDNLGWLFLMQHHRLPTRLLDWTESPLFAAYFATAKDEKTKDDDGALFALSPYLLNQKQVGVYGVLSPNDGRAVLAAKKAFDRGAKDVNYVVGILPSEVHIRVMVQLSVFTLHGSGLLLDDLPDKDSFLFKFRISRESKDDLKGQLKFLGVRESNLFPDLDHLANETSALRFQPPPNTDNMTGKDEIHPHIDWRDEFGSST